jgi:hypothetical protein
MAQPLSRDVAQTEFEYDAEMNGAKSSSMKLQKTWLNNMENAFFPASD